MPACGGAAADKINAQQTMVTDKTDANQVVFISPPVAACVKFFLTLSLSKGCAVTQSKSNVGMTQMKTMTLIYNSIHPTLLAQQIENRNPASSSSLDPRFTIPRCIRITLVGMVLTTFISPAFDIEQATLVLSDFVSIRSPSFATFPVVSNVAHVDVDKPGQIEGWLVEIVSHRTVDGSSMRFNLCAFSQEITDAAILAGHWSVDLTARKGVTFRLHRKDQASEAAIFNLANLEKGGPTFDLSANDFGESAVLAEPGQYIVSAVYNGKSARKRFLFTPGIRGQ